MTNSTKLGCHYFLNIFVLSQKQVNLRMFTRGRIIFALIFVLLFIVLLVWSYRKDIKENARVFVGSKKTLLIIIGFFVLFVSLIRLMKYI